MLSTPIRIRHPLGNPVPWSNPRVKLLAHRTRQILPNRLRNDRDPNSRSSEYNDQSAGSVPPDGEHYLPAIGQHFHQAFGRCQSCCPRHLHARNQLGVRDRCPPESMQQQEVIQLVNPTMPVEAIRLVPQIPGKVPG